MNRFGRATIVLTLGLMTVRLILSGGFGWFVQQRMRLPLLAGAIVLLGLGLVEVWGTLRIDQDGPAQSRRSVGPPVGWLLTIPLLVLTAVAPTGLGAAAADRVTTYTPVDKSRAFAPLPEGGSPAPMRLFDFINRAVWDNGTTLDGVPVELEGLVVNDPADPNSFRLTRFLVSCCAADALPLQVKVRGAGVAFANDTWVSVTLTWRRPPVPYKEMPEPRLVEADATRIDIVDPPDKPYESPY